MRHAILLLTSMSLCASLAVAQNALAPADTVNLGRKVASPGTRAEVRAEQSTTSVSISASKTISSGSDKTFDAWTVTASAPVSTSGTETELFSRDGFANDFSFSVKWTRYHAASLKTGAAAAAAAIKALDICDDQVMIDAYRAATGAVDDPQCDSNNVSLYHKSRYAEYKALFWDPNARDTIFGFEASVGRDEFEFFEAGQTMTTKESKVPVAASLYWGLIPKNSSTLFTVGAEYQRGYKDQPNRTLCVDDPMSGLMNCKEAPFGQPADDDKRIIFVEARRFVGDRAIAPEVSYEFEGSVFEVDLPIYLVADKEKNLRGGIRIGYISKPDELRFGIFVGAAFTPFR